MENQYAIVIASDVAKKRVEDALIPRGDKEDYFTFINNFEKLKFYFNTDLSMSEPATADGVLFPEKFIHYRKILADLLYGFDVEIKFKSFWKYSPREKRIADTWYTLEPGSFQYNEDQKRVLLDEKSIKLLPIGFNLLDQDKNCYLGVSLNESHSSIYEFNMQDLYDNYSSGELIEEMTSEVFRSYPQMLAHISEIKYLEDGKEVIVKAQY